MKSVKTPPVYEIISQKIFSLQMRASLNIKWFLVDSGSEKGPQVLLGNLKGCQGYGRGVEWQCWDKVNSEIHIFLNFGLHSDSWRENISTKHWQVRKIYIWTFCHRSHQNNSDRPNKEKEMLTQQYRTFDMNLARHFVAKYLLWCIFQMN